MIRRTLIFILTVGCVILAPLTTRHYLQSSSDVPFEISVIPKGDLIQGRKGLVEIRVRNRSSEIIALLSMDFENIQTDGEAIASDRRRKRSYIDTRGDTVFYIPGYFFEPENGVIYIKEISGEHRMLRDFDVVSLFPPDSAGQKELKIRPIHGGKIEEKLILKYTTLDKKALARHLYVGTKSERRFCWAPFTGNIDTLTFSPPLTKGYFIKTDAIRSLKTFEYSLTLPILSQYFTLKEAFKTAGLETEHYTCSESDSCWVLFKDGYTYWVSPSQTRRIRGDYIDIVNGVEFSSGSRLSIKHPFTTSVEGRDRRYRDNPEIQKRALQFIQFLSHLVPESSLGMSMEYRYTPKSQLFPFLNEAQNLGIKILGDDSSLQTHGIYYLEVQFLD